MRDYESGFLALILAGVLMMVVGLGLMLSAARSPDGFHLAETRRAAEPASALLRDLPQPKGDARPRNASR